jgi:hypothetical protein
VYIFTVRYMQESMVGSTGCECWHFDHMELYRHNIDSRIKATKRIKRDLKSLAESPDKMHKLFKCEVCGQFWQGSYAWNWGNKEYIYKVPTISVKDWLEEAYIQPDQLLIYNAVMSNWYESNSFEESEQPCRHDGCPNKAVKGLVQCLEHHIEDLQRAGALPKPPQGRWFPPYQEYPT